ncbi:MAG: hypothetical protein GY787_04400, partial [Alteromonadales bacterium]|nr:hypothetical protein [Alteromonadales bacterium]
MKNIGAYKLIGSAIQGTKLGATIASKMGNSKLGAFLASNIKGATQAGVGNALATQTTDILADTIIQSPQEWMRSIQETGDLDQFKSEWLGNRTWDVIFNLAIGGAIDGTKWYKNARKGITNPDALKAFDEKALSLDEKLKSLQTDTMSKEASNIEIPKTEFGPVKGLEPEVGPLKSSQPLQLDSFDTAMKNVEGAKTSEPGLLERLRGTDTEAPKKITSQAERIQEPDFGTMDLDMDVLSSHMKQGDADSFRGNVVRDVKKKPKKSFN